MIILIGSQKGGPGKSTVAINLAVEYAHRGKDVMLVDADAQRSASRWHADRTEAGVEPAIACVEKLGTIHKTLQDLDQRYDIVVVDVAGKDSAEMRSGMVVADTMVVVVRPSQFDLDTLPHMGKLIDEVRDVMNPELTVRGLLSQVPTNPSVTERVDATDYLGDFPALTPLETVIHERKAYRDSISEGLGVVELRPMNVKAKAEIQELAAELIA